MNVTQKSLKYYVKSVIRCRLLECVTVIGSGRYYTIIFKDYFNCLEYDEFVLINLVENKVVYYS